MGIYRELGSPEWHGERGSLLNVRPALLNFDNHCPRALFSEEAGPDCKDRRAEQSRLIG